MSHKVNESKALAVDSDLEINTISEAEEKELDELAYQTLSQMRKGFVSALILAVLKEKELHGYGIKEEIEKKTGGQWTPLAASIYPVLNRLEKKRLVEFKKEKETEGGKTRKIYAITGKGIRFLKFFTRKFQMLMSRLRTLTMGAFGFDGNYPLENHIEVMADHPIFGWQDKKSKKEKVENLKYYKNLIDERILDLQDLRHYIEEELATIQKQKNG